MNSDSREYMRWPREGESMGQYRDYIKRLLVEDGQVVPSADYWAVEANLDTLRQALIDMDEAISHGNPATAKRIARDAFAITAETGSTLRN